MSYIHLYVRYSCLWLRYTPLSRITLGQDVLIVKSGLRIRYKSDENDSSDFDSVKRVVLLGKVGLS